MFLIQARMGSSRLRGKTLMNLYNGLTLIEIVYRRVLQSKFCDKNNVFILTSNSYLDDQIENFCKIKGILFYRGSEENVRERFIKFFEDTKIQSQFFIRVCADNPFIEPLFIDKMIEIFKSFKKELDYVSYSTRQGVPAIRTKYGFFAELVNTNTFLNIDNDILTSEDNEHVTTVFYSSNRFNKFFLRIPDVIEKCDVKLSIDDINDLYLCKKIFNKIKRLDFNYMDILKLCKGI